MPTGFGDKTLSKVYKKEVHKLHNAFMVKSGEEVYKGQPVKLNTDGTISPLASGDAPYVCIGYVIDDPKGFNAPVSVADERTVAMKAFAVVNAKVKEDGQVPGPVKFDSFDATDKLTIVDDASVDATNVLGWALQAGDADDIIRVALF